MWTDSNGEILPSAPTALRQMLGIFTKENLKKYLNKVVGVTPPVGVGAALLYNQNKQNDGI